MNWFNHAKERARFWDKQSKHEDNPDPPKSTRFAGFPWPMASVFDKPKEVVELPEYNQDDSPLSEQPLDQIKELTEPEFVSPNAPGLDASDERPGDYLIDNKEAIRQWKEANPDDTIKHQRDLFEHGKIDQLPWSTLGLEADNAPRGNVKGFGSQFPIDAVKGDMFLRVDRVPSALYKYNGSRWIEVDKSLSDQHAYDEAYIDHLIGKIDSGEYDPELLSVAELEQITKRLDNK
jgi:hypothetical protein